MDLVDSSDPHKLLGVPPGASLEIIKQAYRRLARQYHPDVAGEAFKEQFQRVNEAYRVLCDHAHRVVQASPEPPPKPTTAPVRMDVKKSHASPPPSASPSLKPVKLTPAQQQEFEKRAFYLKKALKSRDWVYALSQAESLSHQFPSYPQAIHLLAITYQRRGNALILEKRPSQARAYLAKALETEPDNKALAFEIERDLRRIGQSSQG
jgi:tetratricopeptide (TPR) repeat protein